jgi:SAM-dependent methyltransferase
VPTVAPFQTRTDRYEAWFERHPAAYESELAAVDRLLPAGEGLEIGVGSGRFAGPLGVEVGLDPAPAMLAHARDRGVAPVVGVAEALPFADGSFDAALLVTTICFVDDVATTLREARRVLRPGGSLVVGFVDSESPLGRRYRETRNTNPFYRDATFVAADDLREAMRAAGYADLTAVQTLFAAPGDLSDREEVRPGTGEGSFVVLRGTVPA